MRVGINTGEVLVGAVRAGREYTAMGDVVNTASRLQEAAEPGTVVVGPETRLVTRDAFEWAEIDPVLAKGKRLPVEASIAVRAIAPPGQRMRRARAPMVGRETELTLLDGVTATAIGRSRAARTGSSMLPDDRPRVAVSVQGVAGMPRRPRTPR